MRQHVQMSDESGQQDLKNAILASLATDGMDATLARYVEVLPALSRERQLVQRLFAQLEQDEGGQWRFRSGH